MSVRETYVIDDYSYGGVCINAEGACTKYRKDGVWYKEDLYGYDSFAETLSSRFVAITNASTVLRCVDYTVADIELKGMHHVASRSESFIYSKREGAFTLAQWLGGMVDLEKVDRKESFALTMGVLKGDQHLIDALSALLQIDRIILNTDRHLNNISFIYSYDAITDMVAYDYGCSLGVSAFDKFPDTYSAADCIREAKSKPFSRNFDEQCAMVAKYSNFNLALVSDTIHATDLCATPMNIKFFTRMINILNDNCAKYLGLRLSYT